MRGFSLLTKFAMITAILFVTLGVAIRQTAHHFLAERAASEAMSQSEFVSAMAVEPSLAGSNPLLGLHNNVQAEISRHIDDLAESNGIKSVTIWNRAARAIYTDKDGPEGGYPPDDEVWAAFTGKADYRFSNDHETLKFFVPLQVDSDPSTDAVLELESHAAPIHRAVENDTRRLYLALLGALGLLYIILIRIIASASHRLQRQASDNEYQALHDGLTALPNRILFSDRVTQALLVSQRDRTIGAVMIMDLDRFKEVNDTLGHHTGDQLLKQAAARLKGALRSSDTVARLGGDEFAVLLHGLSEANDAVVVADKIRGSLRQPFLLEGLRVEIDASIGIAFFPVHGQSVDALLKYADVAMYMAKNFGGGYQIYEAERDEYSPTRLTLVSELRNAIEDGELLLHYQPKLEMGTEEVLGVEALVRWKHPVRGTIPPDEFISTAEQTGLIEPLTFFVLEEAIRTLRAWQESGLTMTVAVNLSARTLQDSNLPNKVWSILSAYGVAPSRLELEITESTIMIDGGRASETLSRLHQMGIQIAIDDFGTGHSSLTNLKRLPVDILKIDKSFVSSMTTNEDDFVIVKSTIDLAHNLGLQVVAEGVETQEIWERLLALGCDAAQGFYRGRPITSSEVPWMVGMLQVPSAL